LKLYWGPYTCAIGTHIMLEEIGKPYETEKLDVAGDATKEDWFKGSIPRASLRPRSTAREMLLAAVTHVQRHG
jgi:glutathione S-transferase